MKVLINKFHITLHSVGAVVDQKGYTYPLLQDKRSFDLQGRVHLKQCSDDWFNAISEQDYLKIEHLDNVPVREDV